MSRFDRLKLELPELERNVDLAPYTTWKLGGPAKLFIVTKTVEDFEVAARVAMREKINWYVIGLGSNVLFSDDGFDGMVIRNESKEIELVGDDVLRVDAGAPLAAVAGFASRHGLSGIEFGVGIPGTIGGGVVGNAGMKEYELKNIVTRIWVVDGFGETVEVPATELQFGYRQSLLKQVPMPVVRVELKLTPGEDSKIAGQVRDWAVHRKERQPIGERCGGSTFKNPEGDSAGRLIEAAGLKGRRIGGAYISEMHANFFINDGTATSADVVELIRMVQREVRSKFGVELELEVRLVGF